MKKHPTPSRKRDHVNLTIKKDVHFRSKSSGFELLEFEHNALPEIDIAEISTTTTFLGKDIAFPFLISCMTGGYTDAKKINRQLAEVCEEYKIAMGVGSQRQALEDSTYHSSFSIVRTVAPSIPIIGNIGAPEVAQLQDVYGIQKLADLIKADAFAVHLNPLQEFLQPEGNTNFRGVLNGIEKLVRGLSIPVIVKEIGAGISGDVARRLVDVGVQYIDVAGAGGTSWAGVEILRRSDDQEEWNPFWDWGIPTVESLKQVVPLRKSHSLIVIASGGINNGIDCAKAIALGADMTAAARPLLKVLMTQGKKSLKQKLDMWMQQFRGAMFLTGAKTILELQQSKVVFILGK